MSENRYVVPSHYQHQNTIDQTQYKSWYQQSIEQPDIFWAEQAKKNLLWDKEFSQIVNGDLSTGHVNWFADGSLNVSVNCLDRHLEEKAAQTAIIWEPENPEEDALHITYAELHEAVCRLANGLIELGIQAGDRICLYLPMIPEAAIAMLACARIGAIHSVVFGGFSADALKDRIQDATAKLVITADGSYRNGKVIALKEKVDQALTHCPDVQNVITVKRTGATVQWDDNRDTWYHDLTSQQKTKHVAEPFLSETPLFILYTSGSTGKPKGVLHTSAGYLLGATLSYQHVLDYRPGDVYWCTADVGWITGHSYIVYGPLSCGSTTVMYEGVPTYPTASRCWEIVDKHQVNVFYTAPTAIRALMAQGDTAVTQTSRSSLRLLGTVGEPINPEAWQWYHQVVGEERCPIVDTWWQTETGSMMIAPLPGATDLKPGSATLPFFGIQAALFDDNGQEILGEGSGNLVIKKPWPSQIRTVFGDHQRCLDTYYKQFPGVYFTGDGAYRDKDGYFWITGRVDDVLNISGHRLGTAEIESALVLHESIAEAAVVGIPHDIKGQAIYAFVTPMKQADMSEGAQEKLKSDLIKLVAKEIGPIAKPDTIQVSQALPKTRSGKIMRRVLRKIASGHTDDLGDTSTLADSSVLAGLIKEASL